jgi:hypothetical protein
MSFHPMPCHEVSACLRALVPSAVVAYGNTACKLIERGWQTTAQAAGCSRDVETQSNGRFTCADPSSASAAPYSPGARRLLVPPNQAGNRVSQVLRMLRHLPAGAACKWHSAASCTRLHGRHAAMQGAVGQRWAGQQLTLLCSSTQGAACKHLATVIRF